MRVIRHVRPDGAIVVAAYSHRPAAEAGAPVTTAADEYAVFIAAQLAEERAAKASLESRGITVITTSGGLVTLLVTHGQPVE